MYANANFLDDNFALTICRLAELGFRGVAILSRKTIPFLCGDPFNFGRQSLRFKGILINFNFWLKVATALS